MTERAIAAARAFIDAFNAQDHDPPCGDAELPAYPLGWRLCAHRISRAVR